MRKKVDDKVYKDLSWHDDAKSYAQMYGLAPEDVERIVLNRTKPQLDPRSKELGHLIVRYKAGDVTVVVGHRDKEHPVIMSVWVETGQEVFAGSKKGTGVKGSSLPSNMREVSKRILADGYKIVHGGSHMRVETKDGVLVSTLPSTPSEYRSVANTWKKYIRDRDRHRSGEQRHGRE